MRWDLRGRFGPNLLGSSCPSSVPRLGRGQLNDWKPTGVPGNRLPMRLERTECLLWVAGVVLQTHSSVSSFNPPPS